MALLATIFLILHFGIGLALPYRKGFKPYYYKMVLDAGRDLERRLNRQERTPSVRATRGTMAGLTMGLLACVAGLAVLYAGLVPYGAILQLAFIACCVNFITPMKTVRQVLADINDLPKAISALQPYMAEPLDNADGHTVLRKTAEFIAVSLNRFLLAPIFWLLVAGPVGMALYVTFSALNRAFGLPDKRHFHFGRFVRNADIVMNIVPAALSAVFLAGSALFVSKSSPWRAAVAIFLQGRTYGFHYEGWLIAALAGGLGITLGGPIRYNAEYSEAHPWVGPQDATARLQPADLSRAALLQYIFFICTIALVAALMIFGA